MNSKQKELFESILTRHVYNQEDRKHYEYLMHSFRSIDKVKVGSAITVTDDELNIVGEYENVEGLVLKMPNIFNKYKSIKTIKEAVGEMRCRFENNIVNFTHNFISDKATKPIVRVYKKAVPKLTIII